MNTFKLPERKTRLIETVSERYQTAVAISQKTFKGRWKVWASEGRKLKGFWGYGKNHKKIVYNFSDGGYSYSNSMIGPSDHKLIAQVANPKDLPLMLNDPKYEKSRDFITDILKGTIPSITKRQDLVKEHKRLEARLRHINIVSWTYLRLLERYVLDKFYNRIYDKRNYGRSVFIILTIGQHVYHFDCNGSDITLVENVEYDTISPEESMETPYRINGY